VADKTQAAKDTLTPDEGTGVNKSLAGQRTASGATLGLVPSVDMPNVEQVLYMVFKAIKAGHTLNLQSAHLARSLKPLMLLSTQCEMECPNLWARGC
jgi:hypothetical protein